jgi:4-oxalocrotonate tautomerase
MTGPAGRITPSPSPRRVESVRDVPRHRNPGSRRVFDRHSDPKRNVMSLDDVQRDREIVLAQGPESQHTQLMDAITADPDAVKDVAAKILEKARAGSPWACELIAARLWPVPRGRLVEFELPPLNDAADLQKAIGAVMQSCAAVILSIEEAVHLSSILSKYVRPASRATGGDPGAGHHTWQRLIVRRRRYRPFCRGCTRQPSTGSFAISIGCTLVHLQFCKAVQLQEGLMPEIVVHALEGRSVKQKRALIKDLTDAMVRNYNVDASAVTINIVESARENKARGGVLFSDMAVKT